MLDTLETKTNVGLSEFLQDVQIGPITIQVYATSDRATEVAIDYLAKHNYFGMGKVIGMGRFEQLNTPLLFVSINPADTDIAFDLQVEGVQPPEPKLTSHMVIHPREHISQFTLEQCVSTSLPVIDNHQPSLL